MTAGPALRHDIAPADGHSRRGAPRAATPEDRVPVLPLVPPALGALFSLIAAPVLGLASAPDGQRALREISILLGDVLDELEENEAILRAADRLYEAALALQEAKEHQFTCAAITTLTLSQRARALPAALAGFRASLKAAKPSARARARRNTW